MHPERLRFVYLYEEVQKKVMEVLTKGNATRTTKVLEVRGCVGCLCHVDLPLRQVGVAWHQDNRLLRPFSVFCIMLFCCGTSLPSRGTSTMSC